MPKNCQLVLFSATFPDNVREFAGRLAPSANEIRLKQEELSVEGIKQFYMDCKNEEHKYDVLVELYNLLTIGQSIIFCAVSALRVPCSWRGEGVTDYDIFWLVSVQKRETADRVAKRMSAEGHKVESLHGKLDTADRDRTIDAFREGKSKVLIATNVIARGIDIMQVTLVINYDMPLTLNGEPDAETYLHRIGMYTTKLADVVGCGAETEIGTLSFLPHHRPNGPIRPQGSVDQLCARSAVVGLHERYREGVELFDHTSADGRSGRDGANDQGG